MAMDLSGFVRKRTTIKLGTKEFIFTELSLADLAEFRAYLTDQRNVLYKERRARLIEDATKIGNVNPLELLKFSDTSISEEEVEAQMETVEGMGYLAYLSLRYACPEISKENVMSILGTKNLSEVVKAMFPTQVGLDEKKILSIVTAPNPSPKSQQ